MLYFGLCLLIQLVKNGITKDKNMNNRVGNTIMGFNNKKKAYFENYFSIKIVKKIVFFREIKKKVLPNGCLFKKKSFKIISKNTNKNFAFIQNNKNNSIFSRINTYFLHKIEFKGLDDIF